MEKITGLLLALFCGSFMVTALADDDHHHRHEYKEEYWDGDCKVKREYKKNGDFKEERKCKAPREREVVYVYPEPEPEVVLVEPQPAEIVLEAPSIVVTPPRIVVK